jgi:predicted DNA-binding WGR domain protein
MTAVTLHRIDPARNMRRFYSLDVQPDLFGGFVVVKEWGRIGARGRIVDELHATEDLAATAMWRQAERKRRRGYAAQSPVGLPSFT